MSELRGVLPLNNAEIKWMISSGLNFLTSFLNAFNPKEKIERCRLPCAFERIGFKREAQMPVL